MADKCNKAHPKRRRTTLSITIDPTTLSRLKVWMKREKETSLSSTIEGFIDCGIRDTCDGCPYSEDLPEEEEKEVLPKIGVKKFAK